MSAGLITIFLGISQLILVNVLWYFHFRHHREHSVYRIRHTRFWYICLILGATQLLLRGINVYLTIHQYIDPTMYTHFNRAIMVLISFSFPFARIFLLWYTVKLQKYEQNSLIKRYLLTEIAVNTDNNTRERPSSIFDIELPMNNENISMPYIYKHSKFIGKPKKFFPLLLLILFIFYLFQTGLSLLHNHNLGRILIIFFLIFLTAAITYISLSLWCCTKPKKNKYANTRHTDDIEKYVGSFNDTFNFRLELTFLLIVLILGVIFHSFISTKYGTSNQGLSLSVVTSWFIQSLSLFTQTFIPYMTYKQNISIFKRKTSEKGNNDNNNNTNTNKNRKSRNIHLLDILKHRYGFFLFMNQLNHELSVENLCVLIEIYQFKYHSNDDIRGYHKKNKFKTKLKKSNVIKKKKKKKQHKKKKTEEIADTVLNLGSLADIPSGQSVDLGNENINVVNMSVPPLEKDTSISTRENSLSVPSILVYSKQNQVPSYSSNELSETTDSNELSMNHSADSNESIQFYLGSTVRGNRNINECNYFSKILCRMPWHGIPLTKSISSVKNGDKVKQALNIYNKYINRNSLYTINISSDAYYQIEEKLNKLQEWKQENEDKFGVINENEMDGIQIVTINDKKQEEKEEKKEEETINGLNGSITPPSPDLDKDKFNTPSPGITPSEQSEYNLNAFHQIKTKTEWIDELMVLFDPILPDIFSNLEDSFHRFRKTKEFFSVTNNHY